MSRLVVFTGGGTGGHVFPGIAVIEKLRQLEPSIEVVWIGSSLPLERGIVDRFGVRFVPIPSGKLRRYVSLRNVVDLFKIVGGLVKALWLLRRLHPPLLFSKGGYVSVPPVAAAHLLGIPVFTHESDVDPGLATRMNARFAERIFVAYEESRKFFPAGRADSVIVSGNPVRTEIFSGRAQRGRGRLGAPTGRPILLVLGGSQGAHQINGLVSESIVELLKQFFVVHQMGDLEYRKSEREGLFTVGFFAEEYPDILAAADLVLARSGAGTLWELAALGKPSILVPLARFSRGDQLRNAEQFAARGAAVVLTGEQATGPELIAVAGRLVREPGQLEAMAKAARSIYRDDAAGFIAQQIIKRIGEVDANSPA